MSIGTASSPSTVFEAGAKSKFVLAISGPPAVLDVTTLCVSELQNVALELDSVRDDCIVGRREFHLAFANGLPCARVPMRVGAFGIALPEIQPVVAELESVRILFTTL